MFIDLKSKYKTIHKRKEESEEQQFVDFTIFICNVCVSVMVRNT